jgi:hypothetical protein
MRLDTEGPLQPQLKVVSNSAPHPVNTRKQVACLCLGLLKLREYIALC